LCRFVVRKGFSQQQRSSHQQTRQCSIQPNQRANIVSSAENQEETSEHFPTAYALYKPEAKKYPVVVSVAINKCDIEMEVDTGVALGIVSEATFDQYFADCILNHHTNRLSTYTGELIKIKGYFDVSLYYHQKRYL